MYKYLPVTSFYAPVFDLRPVRPLSSAPSLRQWNLLIDKHNAGDIERDREAV